VHCSLAQVVPAGYLWQLPAPSQVPSVPQDGACWSVHFPCGSMADAGLGEQMPSDDASAQLRQAPWQASAQQTPSTQKLLPHWLAAVQACPFDLGPQLPLTHVWPLTQSLFAVQRPTQAPSTHW